MQGGVRYRECPLGEVSLYFNTMGRGELSRLIFAQAGIKYEDARLSREEWAELKPKTPTGMLPLLEVDGKPLVGSGPVARFLAEKFGLAGKTDFENSQIAGIVDYVADFKEKLHGGHVSRRAEEKRATEDTP